ncbi:MAG: efflux RND transporter periplasmic adaptor subunit [Anaerolineales bacterium]|nr:efflux RND transporter periplasmic adaptor subunit [Anaerolineales bacterium]
MRRWRIVLIITFAIICFIGIGFLGYQSAHTMDEPTPEVPPSIPVSLGDVIQSVNAPGRLVSSKEILLGSIPGGPLIDIYVQPGDAVEAGQLLAVVGNEQDLRAALGDAEAALSNSRKEIQELIENAPIVTAEAQLKLAQAHEQLQKAETKNWVMQEGHRASSETMAAAEAALVIAQNGLRRAQNDYNSLARRAEDDVLRAHAQIKLTEAKKKVDQALATLNWYRGYPTNLQQSILDAEVAIAEAKLAIAEAEWERVKDGVDPDALELAEANVRQSEARLAKAEAELNGMEVRAPFSGVILEVNANIGDSISANSGFIKLSDLSSLDVMVSVIEEDLPLVEVGQAVDLYFDARPDIEGVGHVERIVPQRLIGDRPLYAVYISIDDIPDGLYPGMTVDASIITARAENVLRLPKSLVHTQSDGTAVVEVWQMGTKQARNLTVGLRGDTYVEIHAGLVEGDQVIAEW